MDAGYRDRTVVITGASDGIGAELALQLAAQRAKLVLAARNAAALERVAAACRARGAAAHAVPTDVTDDGACARLMARASSRRPASSRRCASRPRTTESPSPWCFRAWSPRRSAAMAGRRRELVMTRKARAGMWMKLLAPRVVDRMARAALAKDPASRRPVRQ